MVLSFLENKIRKYDRAIVLIVVGCSPQEEVGLVGNTCNYGTVEDTACPYTTNVLEQGGHSEKVSVFSSLAKPALPPLLEAIQEIRNKIEQDECYIDTYSQVHRLLQNRYSYLQVKNGMQYLHIVPIRTLKIQIWKVMGNDKKYNHKEIATFLQRQGLACSQEQVDYAIEKATKTYRIWSIRSAESLPEAIQEIRNKIEQDKRYIDTYSQVHTLLRHRYSYFQVKSAMQRLHIVPIRTLKIQIWKFMSSNKKYNHREITTLLQRQGLSCSQEQIEYAIRKATQTYGI